MPRVIEGYKKFESIVADSSLSKIQAFAADDLPALKRAMNLYGASLRKGEVPDEISRQAEQLTSSFEESFLKLLTSKNIGTDIISTENAFKAYISFAKITFE